MTLNLNTVHLFNVAYGTCIGRCTGNDSIYARTESQARRIAKSNCARGEKVIYLQKVVQKKINSYAV